MKTIYKIFIGILFLLAGVFVLLLFCTKLGEHPRLENAIQSAGLFVALLVAVIALATADPKAKLVNMNVEQVFDRESKEEYTKYSLSDKIREFYKSSSDPIVSYRICFKITNVSGFTLKNPALSFRLPIQKQHPESNRIELGKIVERGFHSNLYNSQKELRILEFADTRILSNSNLPYWNDKETITIWIRMVLDSGGCEPFIVALSINCENAGGVTKTVQINPMQFISISEKASINEGRSDDSEKHS